MDILDKLIGRNMNMHPDCLGIYIGVDELYIAQTTKNDRGVVLESLVRVPIKGIDKSQLNPADLNESFFVMENWVESLGKVMTKKKWKTNRVVVSLAPAFCSLWHFVVPAVIERKMWKTSIPLQARKYIHFPFEKAEYAYHVYELETAINKQKRLGVVFAMTTKVIIERLRKGLKTCGLELVSVETSSLSLTRAFNESDKEAVGNGGRLYSFFGNDLASFVFINENAPVLMREADISGSIPVERRRFEIANCTAFISQQLERDPFEEVVASGVNIDQWVPALEADSKKSVRKWNIGEVYGIEVRSASEVAAIGASIKFFNTKTPDIDFTKDNRLSNYEFNASLTAWKVVVVLAALFSLLIVKNYFMVSVKAMELSRAKRSQRVTVEDFNNMSSNEIENNLQKVKSQNQNLQGLMRAGNAVTPLLVEIVDSLPQKMWIAKLSYNDEFPGRGGESRSFTLEGFIQSGTKDGRDDLNLGNKFRETLIKQPLVSRICGSSATIRYSDVVGTGGTGGDSVGGAPWSPMGGRASVGSGTSRSKDTRFTLTCSKVATGGR